MSEHPVIFDASKSAEKGTESSDSAVKVVEIVDASAVGKADAADKGLSFVEDDVPKEIGGRDGPEPTRFGDWEKNGRCIDF